MSICKLCNQEKKLLKKSHIIPDFFYKHSGLYDGKHQIHKLEIEGTKGIKRIGNIPTGEYEGNLLCAECDNEIIGNLENYGKGVLFGGLSNNEKIIIIDHQNPVDHSQFKIYRNVDYTRFKLFLLSILWRASISSRDVFKDANIPGNDIERLRLMILNNNAGRTNEYPPIILNYFNDTKMPRDIIFQPITSRSPEGPIITFLIGGWIFSFNISSNFKDYSKINTTITQANEMIIIQFPEGTAMSFILKLANIS